MDIIELRIGCVIYLKTELIFVDISTFRMLSECIIEPEDLTPISLTDKWLTKLGFFVSSEFIAWGRKTKAMNITLIERSVYLCKYKEGWGLAYCAEDGAYPQSIKESQRVKYVHQLQNLYFALVGEELKIELSKDLPPK